MQKAKLVNRDARHLRAIDFIEYAKWWRTEEDAGLSTVLNDIVWLQQACLGVGRSMECASWCRSCSGL
ncbi:hypothetical protein [Comamonas testosteroni]|uniref:hypothetical protein n=1 Tax=Comamonas testosteroni TaxID=285 RepID=UPI00076DD5BA|nr:hypothetical protein [Comamonas testosteroni]KWT68696.1 hypothetical protein APV28_2833 [Comamonas testosteroni]